MQFFSSKASWSLLDIDKVVLKRKWWFANDHSEHYFITFNDLRCRSRKWLSIRIQKSDKTISVSSVCFKVATLISYSSTFCHCLLHTCADTHYRKTSSTSRTKSQNLNVSCLIMQLSLLNQLKPGVKSRMKMSALLQLHLSYQQFYCLLRCDLY